MTLGAVASIFIGVGLQNAADAELNLTMPEDLKKNPANAYWIENLSEFLRELDQIERGA